MTNAHVWWARDRADRVAFEARAAQLVGAVLAHVRYFDIDVSDGVRVVPEGDEWLDPPWRNEDHDLLDWGLELDTSDGRTFAARWETSPYEGIGLDEGRLLETWLGPGASVAIWDVTSTERWRDYVGRTVTRVQVCWERWEHRRVRLPRCRARLRRRDVRGGRRGRIRWRHAWYRCSSCSRCRSVQRPAARLRAWSPRPLGSVASAHLGRSPAVFKRYSRTLAHSTELDLDASIHRLHAQSEPRRLFVRQPLACP